MIDNALDLLFIVGLAAWAAVVGRAVLRAFGVDCRGAIEHFSQSVPLGLGLLSLAVLALGLARVLTTESIVGVLWAGTLVASCPPFLRFKRRDEPPPAAHMDRELGAPTQCLTPISPISNGTQEDACPLAKRAKVDQLRPHLATQGRMTNVCFVFALVAILGTTLVSSLAPVTDGDALCYHLQVPKIFLARHAAVFEPDLHETVYPLVTELLYAVALALRGPVACRLVQWLLGVVFAACATMLARPVLGRNAFWAGTIALVVPAVSNGMAAPLNDVALAAYCTAAVVSFTRWCEAATLRNAAVAGVLAGLALGVKYPALVLVGLLGIVGAAMASRDRHGRLRQLAVFGLSAIAVGGVWYARAYLHTGNPVFPYFRRIFGGAGLDEVLEPAKRPLAITSWNMVISLWHVTLDPDRFDSVSHQLGPLFLMLLPAVFVLRAPRRVAGLVLLGFAFFWICMTQRQSMRFILPAIGPWSVGVAWVVQALVRSRPAAARVCLAIVAMLLMLQTGIAGARVRHGLNVVLGRESRDAYLARNEPTFAFGCWARARLPQSSRIIGQDHRGFYIPRPYTMELAHRRRTALGKCGETAQHIVATLRGRGFTHVLLCPPIPENAVEFDPTLGRLLAPWISTQVPLFERTLADGDGVLRRYSLYALDEAPALAETR